MLVAPAYCPICEAQYLAWIDQTICVKEIHRKYRGRVKWGKVLDLSYLSTFNDEPGESDLPKYDVQVITTWHRVAKIR